MKHKTKKVIWTIFTTLMVLCAITSPAQTNWPSPSDGWKPSTMTENPSSSTYSTPTWGKLFDTGASLLKSAESNAWWTAYYMHAPALEKKSGGGVGVFWPITGLDSTNISVTLLAGTRIDYVNGGFWMPSGNVSVEVPIKMFSWTGVAYLQDVAVIPIAYGGLGVPLSGARVGNFTVPGSIKNNNGDPTAITGFGLAVRLFKYKNTQFDAVYDREKWSGFDGMQDRFGLALNIKR